MKNIVVVGGGYVGLVTGTCFALKGNSVSIVENDPKKFSALQGGEVPFYESGLGSLLQQGIEQERIFFVSAIAQALREKPDVIFICVGTPIKSNGSVDLSFVYAVAHDIGKSLDSYAVVVTKSTVPVGTTKRVEYLIEQRLQKRGMTCQFDVASNPEFLKEGKAVDDFMHPDRIVVGVDARQPQEILYKLYEPFLSKSSQFLVMDIPSAELTKYAANAFLAMRISFMNQLALLADKAGADIAEIRRGIGADERIGHSFLNAGIGYGGSCLPKDVKALISIGKNYKEPLSLMKTVDAINKDQRDWFINRIVNYYRDNLAMKRVGIWGLAFKPGTDDIRCAPALDVIEALKKKVREVTVYDPVAMERLSACYGNDVTYACTAQDVVKQADFLIILTEWPEFVKCMPQDFAALGDKVVFDGRNCFDPREMLLHGITYFCVGRNACLYPFDKHAGHLQQTHQDDVQQQIKTAL